MLFLRWTRHARMMSLWSMGGRSLPGRFFPLQVSLYSIAPVFFVYSVIGVDPLPPLKFAPLPPPPLFFPPFFGVLIRPRPMDMGRGLIDGVFLFGTSTASALSSELLIEETSSLSLSLFRRPHNFFFPSSLVAFLSSRFPFEPLACRCRSFVCSSTT